MKNLYISLALILSTSFLMLSCDKDDEGDTSLPQIQNLKINSISPEDAVSVPAGSQAKISASFSDNVELGSAKINIHDDFDSHGHRLAAAPFSFDTTFTLSGTSWTDTIPVNIPADVAGGPYHLSIFLLDHAGNEAVPAIADFIIVSGSEPQVSVNSDLSQTFHKGDTLLLDGTITDPDGLSEIHIIVEDHESGMVVFNHEFPITASVTSWDIGDGINNTGKYIILNIPGDHAEILIQAKDSNGNISLFEQELHVH